MRNIDVFGMSIALCLMNRFHYLYFVLKEMYMSVSGITEGASLQVSADTQQKPAPAGFSKVLSDAIPRSNNSGPENSGQAAAIELGKISKETPTVSHILINHPEYADKCWDIVFSSENRGKQFTKMREGTTVALKPGSNELVWGRELFSPDNGVNAGSSEGAIHISPEKGRGDKSVVIGTISEDMPTVSHLFQANPHFDSRFWDIINSPVNSNKEYTSLRPGTRVDLDPETMELSFIRDSPEKSGIKAATITEAEPDSNSEETNHASLAEAVKPFIGTPYNQIDCYGLVVKGLMNQGVKYHGHGGLREKLETLAIRDGRPGNAYFSGEGLVEQAGIKVYSKSVHSISNAQEKADEIYSEIAPYLREGQILSFSTPTRGHTGVVSRQGTEWTYINSGVIDHEISPGRVSKRVGEEILKAEIRNWCVLAAGRKEPLIVTAGHVDGNKFQDTGGPNKTI
jgi:hypothetical protein